MLRSKVVDQEHSRRHRELQVLRWMWQGLPGEWTMEEEDRAGKSGLVRTGFTRRCRHRQGRSCKVLAVVIKSRGVTFY